MNRDGSVARWPDAFRDRKGARQARPGDEDSVVAGTVDDERSVSANMRLWTKRLLVSTTHEVRGPFVCQ